MIDRVDAHAAFEALAVCIVGLVELAQEDVVSFQVNGIHADSAEIVRSIDDLGRLVSAAEVLARFAR